MKEVLGRDYDDMGQEAEEKRGGGEGVVVTFRTRFLHVIDDVQLQGGGYCILHPSYNLSVFSNVLKDKKKWRAPDGDAQGTGREKRFALVYATMDLWWYAVQRN